MLEILRTSGLEVRLKSAGNPSFAPGVTEFHDIIGRGVVGVIRFIPLSENVCAIEGLNLFLDSLTFFNFVRCVMTPCALIHS